MNASVYKTLYKSIINNIAQAKELIKFYYENDYITIEAYANLGILAKNLYHSSYGA
jgi:hypothetical protein